VEVAAEYVLAALRKDRPRSNPILQTVTLDTGLLRKNSITNFIDVPHSHYAALLTLRLALRFELAIHFRFATVIQLLCLLLADTPPQSKGILAARKPWGVLTKRTEIEQAVNLYVGVAKASRWEALWLETLTFPVNH